MDDDILDPETLGIIAGLAYEMNRSYCMMIGDPVTPPWPEASEALQKSFIAGVRYRLENPDKTAAELHEAWCDYRTKEGWVYGAVKDDAKKKHPNLVPFAVLPVAQRFKDTLFQTVVTTVKRIHDEEMALGLIERDEHPTG